MNINTNLGIILMWHDIGGINYLSGYELKRELGD